MKKHSADASFENEHVEDLEIVTLKQSASKITLGGDGPIAEYYRNDENLSIDFYG
ncbi:hypothetical protein ACVI1J_007170 [Bradyrhizobium diazoefficiens]